MDERRSGIAVVLSGGGARGAYEAGALSVLLPALEARKERPTVFVGTSAGAINAAAFASLSHLPADEAAGEALRLWRDVRSHSVYRFRPAAALLQHAVTPRSRRRATALLDSSPLTRTLERVIDWDLLHANVDQGRASVAVVATASTTHRSTVFLDMAAGADIPPADDGRSIDYVPTRLHPRHILASSAIPMVFPSVKVEGLGQAADWYIDGGLRLNTPLKPALALDVGRVVVIATDPADPPPTRNDGRAGRAPTAADGAAQVLYAMLVASLVEDLRTLGRRNREATGDTEPGPDCIRWLFAGPARNDAGQLGRLVGEVLAGREGTGRRRSPLRRWARGVAGRWLARDPSRREVLSHLFFDADFIDAAIRLGQRDAQCTLDAAGEELWRQGEAPEAAHHRNGDAPPAAVVPQAIEPERRAAERR